MSYGLFRPRRSAAIVLGLGRSVGAVRALAYAQSDLVASHKGLLVKRAVAHLDKGGQLESRGIVYGDPQGVTGFEAHTISSRLDNKILTS